MSWCVRVKLYVGIFTDFCEVGHVYIEATGHKILDVIFAINLFKDKPKK